MANALACAAANASLDLFEREPRLQQVGRHRRGARARASRPAAACRGVKDVRVKGAIGVVELDRIDDLDRLRARFVEEGVFIRPFGSIVYLTPAFTIGGGGAGDADAAAIVTRSCGALRSEPHRRAVQVVCVGALDLDGGDLADPQRPAARHIDRAVDLRRVALAAALGDGRADLVDDHLLAGADLALEAARRDRLLALHEAVPALLLHLVGHRRREIVGGRAGDRLVAEAADAIELGLVEPVEQQLEIRLGLARESRR